MSDVIKDYTILSDVNPYSDANYTQPTGSINGRIFSGRFVSTTTGNSVYLLNAAPSRIGGEYICTVKIGEFTGDSSASRGQAIMATNGDGYFTLVRSFDLRVYKTTAGAGVTTLTQIGSTIPLTAVDGDDFLFAYNPSNGAMRCLQNGVSRFTATDSTHAAVDFRLGVLSRAALGRIRSFTASGISVFTVTSINGGSPITSSQSAVAAITTGFTGLPTTITTNATGVTCGTITGTTNAPAWVQPIRTDGAIFPKSGTVVTYTFTNGSETASGTQTIIKDANQTKVVVASPINDDITCLFGAIFAATGRSAANDDEVYHTVPAGMSDLVINPDGTMSVTNAGTFPCWIWTAATGINYYYWVTITESGVVIGGGLTSSGLTVSGLTIAGLTSSGL